jgi:hypothetical protein
LTAIFFSGSTLFDRFLANMSAASSFRKTCLNASLSQFLVYSLLFFQFTSVAEAGKFANFCKSLNCFSKSDDAPTQNFPKPPSTGITCPNPEAPKDKTGWSVYEHATPMPKVEHIVADIKLCGILTAETSTVFYSFNGGYSRAKKFVEENAGLKGKTINDVLPDSWYEALGEVPGLNSASGLARTAWVARTSQALATASSGDAYLVADPSANIYTVPFQAEGENAWKGAHNVWFDYEFATLQNNDDVKGIYTVNAETLAINSNPEGSWVRDRDPQGDQAGNHVNADDVTAETLQKQKDEYEEEQEESNDKRAAEKRFDSGLAARMLKRKPLDTAPTTFVTKTSTKTLSETAPSII